MADESALQTNEGLMSAIYDYCGNPPEDKLSPSQVLTSLADRAQHYRNVMNLTDEGWSLTHQKFHAVADKEFYQVSFADFGRPFFVETYDPSNIHAHRRVIEIARSQDRRLYADTDSMIASTSKWSAMVFIFSDVGTPQPTLQIAPIPRQDADYLIWYETILADEMDLDDLPLFLKHFFNLLKVSVCLDVIDFCGWPMDMRNGIVERRMAAQAEYYDTFERYVADIYHHKTTVIRSACSSRMGRRGIGGR